MIRKHLSQRASILFVSLFSIIFQTQCQTPKKILHSRKILSNNFSNTISTIQSVLSLKLYILPYSFNSNFARVTNVQSVCGYYSLPLGIKWVCFWVDQQKNYQIKSCLAELFFCVWYPMAGHLYRTYVESQQKLLVCSLYCRLSPIFYLHAYTDIVCQTHLNLLLLDAS